MSGVGGGMPRPAELLASLGLPAGDLHDLPASSKRFPDGAHYRVEIPSVEGPECLAAVLETARTLGVPVTRVSQGTGVGLLTGDELAEMASLAASAGVEVSLFARPCAGWDASAMARSTAGSILAPAARGQDQVAAVLDEILRAAEHGFRSVLIADIGVLSIFGRLRAAGHLPPDMQAKVSVMLPAANPESARILEDLGADSLNLPTDLTLAQIAAIRAAVDIPLDVYVEAPDNVGGFVRHYELPTLVEVAAPVHVKFGLRNAPDVYPAGTHLLATTVALSRERVRRARLGLDLVARHRSDVRGTAPGDEGAQLRIPVPADRS
ncbi:U32 family peptidase [Nonomuraea sp. NPDC052634]|uniref:U32 family peptidase n=1 Tax=Nonomuraea sp. NPDC052634 TaxID=3155813 RepID=UPI003431CD4F